MSKMTWFKLHSDFRNDPKIKRLPIAERYAFIILLCLANESETRGIITGLDDDDIAFELEMQVEDWKTLRSKFKIKGFIDFTQEQILIRNWDKRQYDKPSDHPEATKQRKRLQRQREKLSKTQDVTPMSRDVTPMSPARVDQSRSDQSRSDQEKDDFFSHDDSGEDLEDSENSFPEQKTSNLSDLDNLEDQETPPPTPAPLSPENSSKAIAISKQAERYQQFEARFTKTKPINRHVPIAFIDAGYAEWHNGAHPLDWRKSLIEVCIQRKKKRGDESTVGAATDFIANIIGDCTKLGMWTKFQNLVDAALKLEQSQAQRSQQQPAPIAVQELTATAPPAHIRERFKTA